MAAAQIQELIPEAPDGFELVRDKIADILKVESAQQEFYAGEAGKNGLLWALRVFVEGEAPWEMYRDPPEANAALEPRDFLPIVNVWFDKATYDKGSSDAIERQTSIGTFNCDCYGYGITAWNGEKQSLSRETATRESQRAARLVRRILMSGFYVNLDLLKLVGGRFPISLETFPVPADAKNAAHVVATRFSLEVSFNEYSPQYIAQLLEKIVFSALRSEGGELLYSVTLDFTSP